MTDLPEGWEVASIKDLFEFKYGKGLTQEKRKPDGGSPVYGSNGVVGEHDRAITRGPTIIVGRKGSVGEVHFSPAKCWPIDTTYFIDEFPDGSPPEYWALYLRSLRLGQQEKSSAIPGISRDDIYRLNVAIPPLNEQRRIVVKIEELLGKVDACQKRLAKIPVILKRFRQSVLAAACSGRLTAEWRDSQSSLSSADALLSRIEPGFEPLARDAVGIEDLPEGWVVARFGIVVDSIRGGSTAVPTKQPTGFPILRSSSVRPGFVDLEDVKYLGAEDSENELNYLMDGDLLFTRLSGSLDYVANCAKVRGLCGRRIQYPDRLFRAKVEAMDTSFCELIFSAPFVRKLITERAKSSAGHQRVSISDITRQPIPIAALEEQLEIVRRVEKLFTLADQIAGRYRRTQAQLDNLPQSILGKAFRGELVPTEAELARREGRYYEPASILLERIREAREGHSRKPRTNSSA